MKKIAIICNWTDSLQSNDLVDIYEDKFKEGCGGSETWVIKISQEFAKREYNVDIYTKKYSESKYSNIRYLPTNELEEYLKSNKYDYCIILRTLNRDQVLLLKKYDVKHIYVLPHDQVIWKTFTYSNEEWEYDPGNVNEMEESHIDKFIALSVWHKEMLMFEHHIPYEKIEIIGNGVDNESYEQVVNYDINEIDHRVLWTSIYKRGAEMLIYDVAPIVRQFIPDFGIDLCSYDGIPDHVKEIEYVNVLPKISKEQYYKELCKHACYFYPCLVEETFGICALEAIMCNQDLISTYEHGMEDALSALTFTKINGHFVRSGRHNYFDYFINDDLKNDDYWNLVNEFALRIVDSIQNYYNKERMKFRKLAKNYVYERHTWSNVVDKWENLFYRS